MLRLRRRDVLAALCSVPLLGRAVPARATTRTRSDSDWPQFQRNPANTGYSPERRFEPADLVRDWSGYAGNVRFDPAVVDGVLYATGMQGTYAYDLASGEKLWEENVGDIYSPAYREGTLYVAPAFQRYVTAHDAGTGTVQWRFDTGEYAETRSKFGVGQNVAVTDETVVVPANTGDPGRLFALDAGSGDVQWMKESEGSFHSAPAVDDGSVYVTGGLVERRDGTHAYSLDDGTEQWASPRESDRGGFAAANGLLYGTGNEDAVFALDASSGDLAWGADDAALAGAGGWHSPAVTDESVVVGTADGTVAALDAANGEVDWTFDAGGFDAYKWATVAVFDDVVLVGNPSGDAYALSVADGSVLWSATFDRAVQCPPIATDSLVVVATDYEQGDDETVHVYRSDLPGFDLSVRTPGPDRVVPGGVVDLHVLPEDRVDPDEFVNLRIRTGDLDGEWSLVRTDDFWTGTPPETGRLRVDAGEGPLVGLPSARLRVPGGLTDDVTIRAEAVDDETGVTVATAETTLEVDPGGFDPRVHGFGFENFGPGAEGHDHSKLSHAEVLRIVGQWDFEELPGEDPSAVAKAVLALALYAVLERVNDVHCYGMCLTADRFFAYGVPADYGDADTAIDLDAPADPLGSLVDEAQQRQNFDLGTYLLRDHLMSDREIDYAGVLERIKRDVDATGTALVAVGTADENTGHQLVAYWYDEPDGEDETGTTTVSVYDPNYSFASDDPAEDYALPRSGSRDDPTAGYRTLVFDTGGSTVTFAGYRLDDDTAYDRVVHLPGDPDYDVVGVVRAAVTTGLGNLVSDLIERAGDIASDAVQTAEDVRGILAVGIHSPADIEVVGPNGERLPEAPTALVEGTATEQVRYGYDVSPGEYTVRLTGTGSGEYTLETIGVDDEGGVTAETHTGTISTDETQEATVHLGPAPGDDGDDGDGGPPETTDGETTGTGDGGADGGATATPTGGDGPLATWLSLAGLGGGVATYRRLAGRTTDADDADDPGEDTVQDSE